MLILAATNTPNATTHSHGAGGLVTIAVVALVIILAGYLALCWLSPFTTCRHRKPRRAWRCRRCRGTGQRIRAGRHLINHLRTTIQKGQAKRALPRELRNRRTR